MHSALYNRFSHIILLIIILFSMGQTYPLNAQPADGTFTLRVNVGGSKWTDNNGSVWLRDHIYSASSGYGYLGLSSTFEKDIAISGTDKPKIYKSERYKLFGYRVDVPNGNFIVTLHFAEIYHKRPGKRIFKIKIEDKIVTEKLDIYEQVGENKALVLSFDTESFNIPVTDNRLDIELIQIKDDTKLSGIEVIQKSEQPSLFNIYPGTLDFGTTNNSTIVTIKNIGVKESNWRLLKQNTSDSWIVLPTSANGSLLANREDQIEIRIDRSQLKNGINNSQLKLTSDGFSSFINITAIKAGASRLSATSMQLDFEDNIRSRPIVLSNDGGTILRYSVENSSIPAWVERIYPSRGAIEIGEKAYLNVVIDRSKLTTGHHEDELKIRSMSGIMEVKLMVDVPKRQNKHIYVNVNGKGPENGRSWDTGYRRLSDLISRLKRISFNSVVEIWVAQGTYYENDIIVPSNVHLYGGFEGNESYREERMNIQFHPTIIDAQRRGRCFEIDNNVVIDGFIIQNGRDWGTGEGKGAGILAYDANVIIRNNIIRNNIDSWAGAVFIEGFDESKKVPDAQPIIEYNVFTENFSNYCAAAVEIRGSRAIVRNNTIINNSGFGLEIQDLLGPFTKITYGDFYNNIIVKNVRQEENNVWAEARKATNYSFVGNKWSTLVGKFKPYDHGIGNIFSDDQNLSAGFLDEKRGDYRLRIGSPCIDSGDPSKKNDEDGSRGDIGAFPYNKSRTEIEISNPEIDFGSVSLKRYVTVRAFGGEGTSWNATVSDEHADDIHINPKSGFLKNGEHARVELSLSRNQIQDGSYTSYFAVMTPHQSEEIVVNFTMNNSKPEMETEPQSIHVVSTLNTSESLTRRIQVSNAMIGRLDWHAETVGNSAWLNLTKNSGSENEFAIINFNPANLQPGKYHEKILITSAQAINNQITVPVILNIQTEKFVNEIQAENPLNTSSEGWKMIVNDGEASIMALQNSMKQPDDLYQLNYEFKVPEGVDHIFVFAEIDVNKSNANDSFWMTINGFDPCQWDYIDSRFDGWQRSWVYDIERDKQHTFVVRPGTNTLNIYSREKGGYINWFVVTNDPDINIKNYKFGK